MGRSDPTAALLAELLKDYRTEREGDTLYVHVPQPISSGVSSWAALLRYKLSDTGARDKVEYLSKEVYKLVKGNDLVPTNSYIIAIPHGRNWYLTVVNAHPPNESNTEDALESIRYDLSYLKITEGTKYRIGKVHRPVPTADVVTIKISTNDVGTVKKLIKEIPNAFGWASRSVTWKVGIGLLTNDLRPQENTVLNVISELIDIQKGFLEPKGRFVVVGNDVIPAHAVSSLIDEELRKEGVATNNIPYQAVNIFLTAYAKKEMPVEFITPFPYRYHFYRYPAFRDWDELRQCIKEFVKELKNVVKEGKPKYFTVKTVSLPDADTLLELLSIAKAGLKIRKSGIAYYNPPSHEVVLTREGKHVLTELHESIHALDWLHMKKKGRKMSDELINDELRTEINKALMHVGIVTDYEHHREPHELLAEALEAYVLNPSVLKNERIRKVIDHITSKYPELKPVLRKLRNMNLKKINEALKKVVKSEFMKYLKKKGINTIPKELKLILAKPVGKLTENEKELLLRWATYLYGRKLLRDASRKAKHKARYVYTWLKNPSRTDIPNIDTPTTKKKIRKLLKKLNPTPI